jgi:hypothetical protein
VALLGERFVRLDFRLVFVIMGFMALLLLE